jgi:hypothetical protein
MWSLDPGEVVADAARMRRRALLAAVAALALAIGGCLATASSSAPLASPFVAVTSSPARSTFCAGATWPPYELVGIPGITTTSIDRATVEITNATNETYYYRVAGWQVDRFETCQAFGEREIERGPIAPGETVRSSINAFSGQLDVPITVAFWDRPCGEACQRAPIAAMVVARSPVEPAAS